MEIEEALRTLLLADGDLVALIGDRIYPQSARGSEQMPLITYDIGDRYQYQTLGGLINLHSCLAHYECHSNDYGQAKALAKRVNAVLLPVCNLLVAAEVTVQDVANAGGNEDEYRPPANAEDIGIHTVHVDLEVMFALVE